MRVAIVGSRDYPSLQDVRLYVGKLAAHSWHDGLVIVSGGAEGVDQTAAETAEALGLETRVHGVTSAEWRAYGRRAGPLRNQKVVDDADLVVAFWTGVSPGTRDVIGKALKAHKHLEVVFP
jgi:hypothetical protein